MEVEFAGQMGGGWEMKPSLQDVSKHGLEPGARRGAGCSRPRPQGGRPVEAVNKLETEVECS